MDYSYKATEILSKTDSEALVLVRHLLALHENTIFNFVEDDQCKRDFFKSSREAMVSISARQLFKKEDRLTGKQRVFVNKFILSFYPFISPKNRDFYKPRKTYRRGWSGNPYYHPEGGDYTDYF